MAESSDTLTLAAEGRAKQGIHELEISFDGELDLHKHYNHCQKNPGHRNLIPRNKLERFNLPERLISWVRRVSGFTVKLSVNYVSPNRPRGYLFSDRAGQRVLLAGSGYVSDFPATGNNDKLPCPFTNCGERPGDHEVYGYITVVTAAHVVFDDDEAKNTTVEFFYDDSDDRSGVVTARGVKVVASSVEGDFCELLCVTHDALLLQRLCYLLRIAKNMEEPICNFFRNMLPALENIESVPGEDLKFLVKIKLNCHLETIKALVVLETFTENVVDRALLTNWSSSKNNLPTVLMGNSFTEINLLNLINFELRTAELMKGRELRTVELIKGRESTRSFSQFFRTLLDLQSEVINTDTDGPERKVAVFMSLISELAGYYSTVQSLKERLSLQLDDLFDIFSRTNRLRVVNISNVTATIEVSLLRRYEYIVKPRYIWKGAGHTFLRVGDTYEPDLNESQLDMLLVHIAHPHGQSKQVTIGRQTDCFTGDGFYHQLYTAHTCSGGPVWMIPASGDLRQVYGVPHSEHYGNQLNGGSSWTIYPHEFSELSSDRLRVQAPI